MTGTVSRLQQDSVPADPPPQGPCGPLSNVKVKNILGRKGMEKGERAVRQGWRR